MRLKVEREIYRFFSPFSFFREKNTGGREAEFRITLRASHKLHDKNAQAKSCFSYIYTGTFKKMQGTL